MHSSCTGLLHEETDEGLPIASSQITKSGLPESDAVEDFNNFCESFDVKAVIAAADKKGRARGFEKEVYALAILRALHNGDFGEDPHATQNAISSLWTRGHRDGFNAHTFKEAFQEYFVCW